MYEMDKAALGKLILARRKEKGYTQKELAARLYVSDKAVSKWERGLSVPDISLLIPMSEVLEVASRNCWRDGDPVPWRDRMPDMWKLSLEGLWRYRRMLRRRKGNGEGNTRLSLAAAR